MVRKFSVVLLCSLTIPGSALGDYVLSAMIDDSSWADITPGESLRVDLVLTSDAEPPDFNTSAIFEVDFSELGLVYDSYTWGLPYQNGGGDDWSTPPGGPVTGRIYFENFADTGEFTVGVIVSLDLTVPLGFLGGQMSRDVVINAIPDTFDYGGAESTLTYPGQPCTLHVIIPEPASLCLLTGGLALLRRRRRRTT